MTLIWFFLGILLALGIARYNESNRLFWGLTIAFLFGYASAVMVSRCSVKENDLISTTQLNPTQESYVPCTTLDISDVDSDMTASKVTASFPVSQEECVICGKRIVHRDVLRRTRDQPVPTTPKPPELWYQKDSLTRHDVFNQRE